MKLLSRSSSAQAANDKSAPALRYALVHDWLPVLGGAEVLFREICDLFTGPIYTSQCRFELFPWLQGREVHTSFVQNMPFALRKHYIYAPIMPWIYRSFDLHEADVVLVGSHSFAHHAHGRPDAVTICYYHTTARSLWNPEIDDRARAGRMAWARRLMAPKVKSLDLVASQNPDFIIANSQTTAQRIRDHYHREPDEIIYPPVCTKKWNDVVRKGTDGGLLMWGRLIRYKRFDLAIEAVRITGDDLHIVGTGAMEARLRLQAAGMKNVHFHGRLPDEELKKLMERCAGVLFPGYEDFGIIPVEAMAAGIPVVALAAGGAIETLGDQGILFERQDATLLAEAIGQLKKRQFLPDALKARAAQFDVEIFRVKFVAAVQRAIDQKKQKLQRSLAA